MDNDQGADPAAGAGASHAGGDWRSHLQPVARGRIVNKIMEMLKKQLPVSVPEGLIEIQKIAVKFEEKVYAAASSQSDYLRKISVKMLSMESQHKTNTQQNPQNGQVAQENPQNGQVVQNQIPCYLASTSHTGILGADDLNEALYRMNKTLKDKYLAGLGDLHEIYMKLHGDNHIPNQKPNNVLEEVNFKSILERTLHSLQVNKRPSPEESIPMYKRQIMSIINSEEWKPEQTFQQSSNTNSSGVLVAHGTLSPERGNVKRLRPSAEDDIHSLRIFLLYSYLM